MDPVPRNSLWKILIGLAIVCGLLVFAGGFFHRRALEQSVQDAQDAAALYVRTKLTHDVAGMDLSQPLKRADASSLEKASDLPGDTGLRIFAPNGTAVFTDEVDPFPVDEGALATAKTGGVSRVIDGVDLRVYVPVDGKGENADGVAAVVWNYTQMRKGASGPLDDYRLPLVVLGVLLLAAGILLMLRSTDGSASVSTRQAVAPAAPKAAAPSRPAKGRVTGFEPVVTSETEARSAAAAQLQAAVTEASATAMGATVQKDDGVSKSRLRFGKRSAPTKGDAPDAPKEKRSLFGRRSAPAEEPVTASTPTGDAASALQREIAIRQALEDQLEQLRTQVKTQKDERVTATRELTEQLEAAARRAEEAEAQLQLGGGTASAAAAAGAAEAAARITALEQELAQSRAAASEAKARADQLLQAAQAAPPPAPTPDPAAEQRAVELTAQLADAQQRASAAEQRASSAEQRAASVESVRDELEVKVAQLGARATELEQRAAQLEGNLQEANAGGDAVRAEIATLTAALAGANARVQELEAATSPTPAPEHEAEIARLRAELAKQLERAQSAEDRIASLEADVLAAQQGVRSLAPHDERHSVANTQAEQTRSANPTSTDVVPPAPSSADRYDDVWSTPTPPAVAQPSWSEPASTQNNGDASNNGSAEPEREPDDETAASSAADEPADEEPPAEEDMWSLRARLAEAATRKREGLE